jgi:uncharacterized membrane protein (DUF4010 family)
LNEEDILVRLGLALAAGFLIGLERGWRQREEGEGERTAGLRTFSLIGLAGGLFALAARELGEVAFAAGFVAVAAAITLFRWRESNEEGAFGATTVIAAFVTFAIGAIAVTGSMTVAAAAAVATTVILAAKGWLHAWLRALKWEELRATLILAAMSFVALPVLPDQGFGPYEALNPRQLWLMTIAIAGVSFIGYLAVKLAGSRYGLIIAGIAGGAVSSTATTLDLARKAKASPGSSALHLAGALAASAVMFLRVTLIVATFGPALFAYLVGPLAAALVVLVGAAIAIERFTPKPKKAAEGDGSSLKNPFEIKTVAVFAALLAATILLSEWLTATFGGSGGIVLAAIAGISDVDAITLSMTKVGGATISASAAQVAILAAVAVNTASKTALAFMAGGSWFGLRYGGISAVALIAGGVIALFEPWSF